MTFTRTGVDLRSGSCSERVGHPVVFKKPSAMPIAYYGWFCKSLRAAPAWTISGLNGTVPRGVIHPFNFNLVKKKQFIMSKKKTYAHDPPLKLLPSNDDVDPTLTKNTQTSKSVSLRWAHAKDSTVISWRDTTISLVPQPLRQAHVEGRLQPALNSARRYPMCVCVWLVSYVFDFFVCVCICVYFLETKKIAGKVPSCALVQLFF